MNRNGNIMMTNANSSNANSSNSNNSLNNSIMENAFLNNNRNNLAELNKIKTQLKRAVSKLNTEANTLTALIQRIDVLGNNSTNVGGPTTRLARKNALRIQRVIHPNKSFPLTKGIQNNRLRNKVRRNLTDLSAAFQI